MVQYLNLSNFKKKMFSRLRESLKQTVVNLFLKQNTLPAFLLIAQQSFQFALYLLIIHNPTLINDLMSKNYSTMGVIGFLLGILVLVRIKKGISAFKIFYPIFLSIIFNQQHYQTQALTYFYFIMIAFMLVADTISNIKLDFNPQSITSETLNFTKILHLVIFLFGVIYSLLNITKAIFQIISGVLFITLAIIKRGSLMRNDNFKQVILRFYLLIGFDHFTIFLNSIVSLPIYLRIFLPIAVSWVLYELYKRRKKTQKIDQLFSQQLFFDLCFRICRYVNGKIYDATFQQEINQFINDQITPQMREHEKKLVIYQKISNLLARQQYFQNYLLLAQIYMVYKHQLLKAKKSIEIIKKNTKYHLIQYILIYRAEEMLFQHFSQKNKGIFFQHYQSLFKCDQFRSLLLKSSIHYINFWEFTKKPEVITQDLRSICNKTVDYQRKINKNYEKIEIKCVTMSLLYVSYLFEVARDAKRARKILEQLSFNQDFQENLQINEKIVIRAQLMEQFLKIQKIGHNVSLLLGYDRKEIQGQKIDMFIPQFFRKIHKEKVELMLQNQFQRTHLFNKKTIIKNKSNYYQECNVVLRLHYDFQGELRLQGYLQIKQNIKYNWPNYLIVNKNEQILECSESFSEIYPNQSKLHKTNEFFSEKRQNSKIKYHYQSKYFPLLIFKMNEEQQATYFVEISEDYSEKSLQLANDKIITLMSSIKNFKVNLSFIKSYYQAMNKVYSQIFKKQYTIIFLVCLLLVLGIITCQTLFFYTMKLKERSQSAIVSNTTNIVLFMNSFNRLGLGINYIDLNKQIGYNNNFTTFDLINQSLTLQTYAEEMRYLSTNNFTLPSFLPNVTYPKLGFDSIMEYASNAYMVKQFQDDSFTQNLSLTRIRLIMSVLYSGVQQQFRNNYITQIQSTTFFDQIINQILISVMIFLIVVLYLLIIRVQLKLRLNEKEALSLTLFVKQQDPMIQNVKSFIRKITRQEISFKGQRFQNKSKIKIYQTSFAPDASLASKDPMRSEISMREMSGRNLMEDTLNKTLFLQSQQTQRNQPKAQLLLHSVQVKLRKRNKVYYIVPQIFLLIIIAFIATNQIKNNIIMNIDQGNSTQNIFSVLKLGHSFVRIISVFFNTLTKKMTNIPVSASAYLANFSSLPSIPAIIPFEEQAFSEFSAFTSQLITFQTQYMCLYIKCDPRYSNDINIVYTATVQKMLQFMNDFVNTSISMSNKDFQTKVTSPNVLYYLDLLFYVGKIMNEFLESIYKTYVNCYKIYTDDLISSKTLLVSLSLAISTVGVTLLMFFFRKVYIHQHYLKDIIAIVKTDNHVNEQMVLGEENQKEDFRQSEIK